MILPSYLLLFLTYSFFNWKENISSLRVWFDNIRKVDARIHANKIEFNWKAEEQRTT